MSPPSNFIEQATQNLGVTDGADLCIGWKTCDDKKRDDWKGMETIANVQGAFEACRKLMGPRRTRAVWLEICNTHVRH